MNYFKLLFRALKRLMATQIYISPEDAVKRYREKGVIIGENTELYKTSIDSMRPFLVTIGSNTIITGSRILTHDASTKKALGFTKIGKVSIGDNVFWDCDSLTSIKLPSGLTSIGDNAFWDCDSLTSIELPSGLNSIGDYAFSRGAFVEIPPITIYGASGSYAEIWAKENGCTFVVK